MTEISNYAKYRVSGPGAEAWLSSLLTARMPRAGPDHADRDAQRGRADRRRVHGRAGRPRPTSSTSSGRCRPRSITRAGSATTCRRTARSGSRSSGWAWSGCPSPGRGRATSWPPIAPDLDLSTEAFPFMTFRRVDLGMTPVLLARINYAGDLGYELWVDAGVPARAVRPDRGRRRAARPAAVRDAGADVAPAREELRDVVPRVPADLHAARGRDHPLHPARPRVHRAGGPRGRGRARRAGPPARRVRRRARPRRPGRRHRRRAGLARRRGRRLDHLGRVRPPRQAVDRARVRAGRAGVAGRPGRRRFRDRDHRPAAAGPAPARAAVRPARASGCASDRGAGTTAARRPDRRRRPAARGPRRRLARGRDPPGRRAPGRGGTLCLAGDCGNCLAVVDGIAYVRTCQVAGAARARSWRGIRSTGTRRSPSTRCRAGRRRSSGRVGRDASVIGGGSAGRAGRGRERRGRAGPRRRRRRSRSPASIPGRRSSRGRRRGCSTSRRDEIVVATGAAEIQPVCPGNDLAGLLTAARGRAAARRGRRPCPSRS